MKFESVESFLARGGVIKHVGVGIKKAEKRRKNKIWDKTYSLKYQIALDTLREEEFLSKWRGRC